MNVILVLTVVTLLHYVMSLENVKVHQKMMVLVAIQTIETAIKKVSMSVEEIGKGTQLIVIIIFVLFTVLVANQTVVAQRIQLRLIANQTEEIGKESTLVLLMDLLVQRLTTANQK